jgi:carboxyl-terminal processing protease
MPVRFQPSLRRREPASSVRAAAAAAIALIALTLPAGAQTSAAGPTDCRSLVGEAWAAIDDNYFDPEFGGANWIAERSRAYALCARGDDAHKVIRTMLRSIGSRAIRWIDAERAAALPAELNGAPGPGIGLIELLSIDIDERTGLLTIVTPVPGSPAALAGLRPGDIIETIDGVRSDTMSLAGAVDRIRGAPGTVVALGVRRGEQLRNVRITRAAVSPEPIVEHRIVQAFSHPYGYLRLNRFVPGAGEAVAAAVDTLERAGANGIVLDLRDNPGGLVAELIAVADVFLRRGVEIASIAGRPGNPTILTTEQPARTLLPLAILIDRGTASAAEALTEALQAAGRGAAVGNSRTFGKGLAHSIQPLSDGSAIMVPTGRLISPSARDILAQGVEPAVFVDADGWPVLDPAIVAGGPDDMVAQRALALLSGR